MITTVLSFIFVLGVLILFHEFGHFLAAKKAGIKVLHFSIGFPPKIFGKKIGDTEYRLCLIPFGGYIKMAGENPQEEEIKGEPWEFMSKPVGIRAIVIAAGPIMNFILALLVFTFSSLIVGISTTKTTKVGKVESNSPAERWGFEKGDLIVSLNGQKVKYWYDINHIISSNIGHDVQVGLIRDGRRMVRSIDIRKEDNFDSWIYPFGLDPFISAKIGFVFGKGPAERAGLKKGDVILAIDGVSVEQWLDMSEKIRSKPGQDIKLKWQRDVRIYETSVKTEVREGMEKGIKRRYGIIGIAQSYDRKHIGPVNAVRIGSIQTYYTTALICSSIWGMITRQISPKELGGPLLIAQAAGESARSGIETLMTFMALLSVNLGLLNLLPIPALDGGHLLFLAVEKVIKRPISLKQRAAFQQIGLAILLFLMIYVTFNDITRWLR